MNYKAFDSCDLDFIRSAVSDPARVLFGDALAEEYSHDELGGASSRPDVVVQIVSAREASAIMAYANIHHIPVTPRGAGTGLVGALIFFCANGFSVSFSPVSTLWAAIFASP